MVDHGIELVAQTAVLRLDWDESHWCNLRLIIRGDSHELGADVLGVVVKRLHHGLSRQAIDLSTASSERDQALWVLSLAEKHCSIFVDRKKEATVIYVQGADGSLVARVSLIEDERREWIRLLEQLLDEVASTERGDMDSEGRHDD